ncbi:sugar ABC transporter substrate-binding protein [Carboxydochorda subterranea]|uniref:Sugar ABC transporter substrate-binding protein n=1 Tax=Carboxydichorda subterranea TaxID=3109565 RepID=A0ABZ1BUC9_9FIRM|nr:sugar ABC transporter substrate-binding protein [Limnochorda sp. L945t]WRP16266.1 sugar ABC transporter substrate-binding protein [Limnochorda sp. L945t]
MKHLLPKVASLGRVVGAAMLLAAVLALTGGTSQAADKQITLSWWSTPAWPVNGDVYYWQKSMIQAFEETHPNVKIKLTQLDWASATTKLDTAIMARQFPDIATGGAKVATWAKYGILEPIDPYLTPQDRADYYPVALKKFTYQGKIYGWPWFTTTYVIYLNLDIFKERGIEPPKDGNWTWDEFVETAKKLTFKDKNGQQVYGFGAIMQPFYYQAFGVLLSDGGQLLSPDEVRFGLNTAEGVSGLQKLVDLVQKHKVSPLAMGSAQDADMTKMFTDGHLAMLAQGTFYIRQLEKALEGQTEGFQGTPQATKPFPFAVANYPIGKLGRPISLHEGVGGFVVFKHDDKDRVKAAMEFGRFLTSPENQKALTNYGTFPSRRSVGDIYTDDPYLSWALRNAVPTLDVPPVTPSWLEVDKAIVPYFQLAILGKQSAEEAMANAARAADAILKASR